jgi:hypothetical protein
MGFFPAHQKTLLHCNPTVTSQFRNWQIFIKNITPKFHFGRGTEFAGGGF